MCGRRWGRVGKYAGPVSPHPLAHGRKCAPLWLHYARGGRYQRVIKSVGEATATALQRRRVGDKTCMDRARAVAVTGVNGEIM